MIEGDGPGSPVLSGEDRAGAIAAVKAALALTSDEHDALIAALAETALGLAEQFCGAMLLVRAVSVILPVTSGWQRLEIVPVRAITGVDGIAGDGARTALPAIGYEIDIDARGEGWVRLREAGGARRCAVSVSAGRASGWAALPAPVRQGVVMLAAYLFSERDTTRPPPQAITALWRPFRGLAVARPVHA